MKVSYKKLWKLLIDKDMKKRDLERCAGISHYTINKLNHGENVTTDILGKICKALGCTMNDITTGTLPVSLRVNLWFMYRQVKSQRLKYHILILKHKSA